MKIKEYVIKEIRKSYNEEELTDDQKKEIEVSAENIEKRLEYLQRLQEKVLSDKNLLSEFIKLTSEYMSEKHG